MRRTARLAIVFVLARAGDGTAHRRDEGMGESVGACDGDEFRIGVDGNPRFHIGGELANLGGVLRGADSVNFREPERRGGRDETGVQLQFAEIDNFCLASGPDVLANGLDDAIGDEHSSVDNGAFVCRVNCGGFIEHCLRLLLSLRFERGRGE